ncbi:MAG: hypothetical protein EOO75_12630, partial [Myxococcales bacterium]
CAGPEPGRLVSIDDLGRPADGPYRIDADVQPALAALLAEASGQGHFLRVVGAHRTHLVQEELFATGPEIGRFARPGHSEHELGLAVDLDHDDGSLAFLRRRGPAHGFITSYPAGREHRTGFRAEPWHQRYVGPALAAELTARDLTLQEYLESSPARGRWGDCSDCRSPLARARCDTSTVRCDGDVLRWCMAGDGPGHEAPAAVDCRTTGGCCDPEAGRCGACATSRPPVSRTSPTSSPF